MNRVRGALWSAVGVVLLAYLLMGVVQELLPLLIVAVVLYVLYTRFFFRRW